jgi:hypothetical protein
MQYLISNRTQFKEVPNRRLSLLVLATVVFVALIQSGCVAPGSLGVSPANVNFGSVPLGSSSSKIVTITNSSIAPLTITQAAVSGKGFNMRVPALPLTLAVGQSAQFTTSFAPAAVGITSGSVSITKTQASTPQLTSGSASATPSITTQQATIELSGAGVSVAPSITTQPGSQTVTAGQAATFLVAASGEAPLTYQWRKNGTSISGATSTSYTTPAEATSDSGSLFTVVVSNSAGNVTSNAATLTVNAASVAPSITTQPASQTVATGQAATFLVAASSEAPLNYQWRKNGAPINGATSTVYTIPAAATSDSGSQFSVVVSNSAGTVTSNVAVLTVSGAGQLTANLTKLNYGTVTVGSSDILPVTLTNTGGSSVSISNVTLSGVGLSIGGVSSGLILAAGNSATLNVTFAPAAAGTLSGSVTVASNATDSTLTISLSGTAVQPVSHSVTLNLAPNSSNVTGYNVYRSTTSSGPYTKLNSPLVTSTTYTDTSVVANQTYFYVGTSLDSAGDESTYSNQVSATIPTP